MKKMSKRTKRLSSSPQFAVQVLESRKAGLGKILKLLSKGTRVQATEGSIGYLAARKQLF